MSLLRPIDNRMPPNWENPPDMSVDDQALLDSLFLTPEEDRVTRFRFLEGHDEFNYFTDQRVNGDTIVRDLVLLKNQRSLLEFLMSYAPTFSITTPTVVIPPGDSVIAHSFTAPPSKRLTAISCFLRLHQMYAVVEPEDVVMQLERVTSSNVVLTLDFSDSKNWPASPLNPSDLTPLTAPGVNGGDFVLRYFNNSDHEVAVSGNLAVGLVDE